MIDDVCVLDRLVTNALGDATMSRRRSAVATVSYFAAGLGGVLLTLFGDGGIRSVLWGLFAVVFVVLGVTLAVHRSRRS